MVTLKDGVSLDGLQPEGRRIYDAVCEIATRRGLALVITCSTGGHPEHDPHTHGFALDVRTINLSTAEVVGVHDDLAADLGADYTVRFEAPADWLPHLDPPLRAMAHAGGTAPHLHGQYRKDLWPVVLEQRAHAPV